MRRVAERCFACRWLLVCTEPPSTVRATASRWASVWSGRSTSGGSLRYGQHRQRGHRAVRAMLAARGLDRAGGLANLSGDGDLDVVICSALKGTAGARRRPHRLAGAVHAGRRRRAPRRARRGAGGAHAQVRLAPGRRPPPRLPARSARSHGRGSGAQTNRPELVAEHGYDTKFAMHALRLGAQGVELLTTGRITLPVPVPDPPGRTCGPSAVAGCPWPRCRRARPRRGRARPAPDPCRVATDAGPAVGERLAAPLPHVLLIVFRSDGAETPLTRCCRRAL